MSAELPSEAELKRYVDRCREMSEDGKYSWWSRLADILTALDRDRQLSQASHGAVRVKALEWDEYKALGNSVKTLAHDCFGNEFRRFDMQLKDIPQSEIRAAQADYERHILSALTHLAPTHENGSGGAALNKGHSPEP